MVGGRGEVQRGGLGVKVWGEGLRARGESGVGGVWERRYWGELGGRLRGERSARGRATPPHVASRDSNPAGSPPPLPPPSHHDLDRVWVPVGVDPSALLLARARLVGLLLRLLPVGINRVALVLDVVHRPE